MSALPPPPQLLSFTALRWLILALLIASLPHFAHLPLWVGGLWGGAMAWYAGHVWRGWPLPGLWLRLALVILVTGLVVWTFGRLYGRDAGVGLLAAMAALKLLETRRRRDGLVLAFLAYLLLTANLLFDQTIPLAVYLFPAVTLILAAQLVLYHPQGQLPWRWGLGMGWRFVWQAVPIMLVLFVLFPRIPGPIWGLPQQNLVGRTGVGERMSPGDLSELALNNSVAFRARFEGEVPAPIDRYWRGLVLEQFDGIAWTRRDSLVELEVPSFETDIAPLNYAVILEPHGQRWLFALDLPGSLPELTGATYHLQLMRRFPVNELLRYEMRSYPRYHLPTQYSWERPTNLFTGPRELNPQTRALGEQWRQTLSPAERVNAALQMFRDEAFHYTLRPPRLTSAHRMDEFLFETRRGFCEHYASAFALLMRYSGVPARVVVGYQGGERNAFGDYWIVRQSDAHAWNEVLLDDMGWVRVDPTAAIAPNRVEQGLEQALDAEEQASFGAGRLSAGWLYEISMTWDAVNNAWNEYVLAYGPTQQQALFIGLGLGALDWPMMTGMWIVALGIGILFVVLWQLWQRHQQQDPLQRLWQQFCAQLARQGCPRHRGEAPLSYGRRIAEQHPEWTEVVTPICETYCALRYGKPSDQATLSGFAAKIRQFKLGRSANFRAFVVNFSFIPKR